jgi:hypothetical protein
MREVKRRGGEGEGAHLGSSSPIPMAGGGRSDREDEEVGREYGGGGRRKVWQLVLVAALSLW